MNDVELIQSFCLRYVNKLVRQHFKDIENLAISDNLNLTNARQISRQVCFHKDNDPITVTTSRLILFSLIMGNFQLAGSNEVIYGLPALEFHETVKFQPQVVLWFRESTKNANARDSYPARARVSFRLKDENLTESEAKVLAKKIKSVFATPIIKFRKGRKKISYIDKPKGYQFILTVDNESDAREIIQKTMSLQNDNPDWSNLTDSESNRNWSATQTKTILSKKVTMPKRRPIATVEFHHAELKIHGLTRDVCLVDTSGRYRDAYEIVA
ncbi:MAG: hypothetical protein QNJ51_13905 [Calothrix sp. MO_167.B12]|nr:hypothetical protein [Calothrix sp. MO_167.B12]